MEMPKPGEAHAKFRALAGSWRGEERLFPSAWDPKGGMALGRVKSRTALGGLLLVTDVEQERNGQCSFEGHGVLRWDASGGEYVMHWFDSMDMPPNVFRGRFEGTRLVLRTLDANGETRLTYEIAEARRYSLCMEFSGDGRTWQPFLEGKYERVEGPS